MNPDSLLDYHNNNMKENPFYPIKPEDFDKTEELVITKQGLEQVEILKHECIMGRATVKEKIDFIDLMRIYATTNSSLEILLEWKKYLDRYFDEIIKDRYYSNLLKDGFAMRNPKFNSKYMKSHDTWQDIVVQKYYSLIASGV